MSANHENDPVKMESTDPSSTDFALEHPKPAILRTTISREKQLLKQHQQNQVLAFSEPKKHKSKSKANKITAQNQTKNKPTPTIANLDFDVSQQLLSLLLPFERQSSKYDLWVELALLSKVYRKYRFQQRNSINFKKLEQLKKCLDRLKLANVQELLKSIINSFYITPTKQPDINSWECVPSRRFIYLSTLRIYHIISLLKKIEAVSKYTYSHFIDQVKSTYFMTLSLTLCGICSRIMLLVRIWIGELSQVYELLTNSIDNLPVLLASEEYKNHKKGEFLVPKLENITNTNNSVNHKVVFDYHQPNIVERPLTRTLDNGFGCNYVMETEIKTLDLHNLDEPKHSSTSIGVSSDLCISKNNTDSFRKNTTTQKNSAIFDPFSFDDDLGDPVL